MIPMQSAPENDHPPPAGISRRAAPAARIKLAELTSSVGAGVLGMGIGALFARQLHSLAIAILVTGLAMHAFGMFDKHRAEQRQGTTLPWWSSAFYWLCWIALGILAVVLTARWFFST